MRMFFLKNHTQNVVERLVPDSFIKKSKLSISMDQQSQMLQSFFFLYVQVEVYQNILEVRYWLLTFTLYKAFLKNKKKLELVSLPHFNHDFWKEVFITLYFTNWPNFIAWLPSFLEILGNRCIIIICSPICDVINFEINHKAVFLHN